MKKTLTLFALIFILILAGCSQAAPKTAQEKPAEQAASKQEAKQEPKQEAKPKTDFPKKPIEMIVPYAAGGANDVAARILANVASTYLPNGQNIVIVNKPGGASIVGTTELFQAKPDGYKIGMIALATLTNRPHTGNTMFTHDSFDPVMQVFTFPQTLFVKQDASWKTFEEWLAYVKANPGKFTYGIGASGSSAHLTMESFAEAAGVQLKVVPFDGGAPAVTALMGGHIQGAVLQSTLVPEGRKLAMTGSKRSELFKDVPTLKEKGFDVGLDEISGLLAPKGTPKEVIEVLHDAFRKALNDPEVIEQFRKVGAEPMYASGADFQKTASEKFKTNGELMKKLGLTK